MTQKEELTPQQRAKVIDFVRKKSFRREGSVIKFIEKLVEGRVGTSSGYVDVVFAAAQLVEQGPLEWFGAEEERYGAKAAEMQMMYRYSKEKVKEWKSKQYLTQQKQPQTPVRSTRSSST